MLLTDKGRPDTTARHVLQALAEHAHKDGSGAHPSVLRLQYRTGYDRTTVQRALRRLEKGGLIQAEGQVQGRTRWRLMMRLKRPEFDWAQLEADEEAHRASAAERKRRSRAKDVTHAESVTVTDAESVTQGDVTDSEYGRHASQVRDVTHSASGRHALSAALTTNEPPLEPPATSPPDGRRPTTGSRSEPAGGSAAPTDQPYEKIPAADIARVVAGLPAPVRAGLA
ncbi:helix-turn-helix domain-containing protein, partial [Streptomyces sp. PA03-6a]|nr:helix-turn-helix domain-containing protein [Streptomyces sp. PA03-6a]